jgi:hypothetical protein
MSRVVGSGLQMLLPSDAHVLCSGRLHVSVCVHVRCTCGCASVRVRVPIIPLVTLCNPLTLLPLHVSVTSASLPLRNMVISTFSSKQVSPPPPPPPPLSLPKLTNTHTPLPSTINTRALKDLVQVLLASCYIPLYASPSPLCLRATMHFLILSLLHYIFATL